MYPFTPVINQDDFHNHSYVCHRTAAGKSIDKSVCMELFGKYKPNFDERDFGWTLLDMYLLAPLT